MKITRQTIDILRNFSSINSSILVDPGSELQTIAARKNILAKSSVEESFNQKFVIYDLVQFLGLITTESFEDAELDFDTKWVNIVNGRSSSKYFYADESTIIKPERELIMPETEIKFELDKSDLTDILNMAGILATDDLAISSDGDTISAVVLDKQDDTSNHFKINVGDGNGDEYTAYFKIENLKVLKGTYDVSISSKGITHWANTDIPLEYWIALEPDSIYETLSKESI